ncbi:unnamed protein product [Lactuca saligna]|uniref:Transposase MuDR plant domain-containing protein n=1 Tax=Lactuca saligna TaxID=75948 RepID=A0AA35VFG0_LACSI|nr:unnamed protein product [Lactuca saligna]
MESPNSMYLTVEFHYNGMFAPNPLVYLDHMTITHERLTDGIRRINNDVDYFEFVEDGYMAMNELRMNVYIDHQNEPILDWADKEMLTGDEKTIVDDLFNKLCGKPILNSNKEEVNDDNDDDASDEDDEVMLRVFDENQEWDKMVIVLGMKFSNPLELKLCLNKYSVKNGYDLWYKNDHQKLLAKCSEHKKNKSCPFRLWATWMNERSLKIKSLIDRNNCSGVFKFGSIELVEALKESVPAAEHRQCAKHIYANF